MARYEKIPKRISLSSIGKKSNIWEYDTVEEGIWDVKDIFLSDTGKMYHVVLLHNEANFDQQKEKFVYKPYKVETIAMFPHTKSGRENAIRLIRSRLREDAMNLRRIA